MDVPLQAAVGRVFADFRTAWGLGGGVPLMTPACEFSCMFGDEVETPSTLSHNPP